MLRPPVDPKIARRFGLFLGDAARARRLALRAALANVPARGWQLPAVPGWSAREAATFRCAAAIMASAQLEPGVPRRFRVRCRCGWTLGRAAVREYAEGALGHALAGCRKACRPEIPATTEGGTSR
jgi:hypothetical protein